MAGRTRIAITGAAGSLAHDIVPGLMELGYEVVGVDRRRSPELGIQWVESEIADRARLREAFAGCEAVIHLAGIPLEDEWSAILAANIDGTQAVLEAAHAAGVPRAVLASSIHAAGYVPVPPAGELVPAAVPVRPNTFYGVSKAAVEALGSLYHDRYGMQVVCLRIASRFAQPLGERMLSTWLSPADAVRLFAACLTAPEPGFAVVWGVSRNTRAYLSGAEGAALGFEPQDDAERYAGSVPAGSDWDRRFIGGDFCSPEPPRHQGGAA